MICFQYVYSRSTYISLLISLAYSIVINLDSGEFLAVKQVNLKTQSMILNTVILLCDLFIIFPSNRDLAHCSYELQGAVLLTLTYVTLTYVFFFGYFTHTQNLNTSLIQSEHWFQFRIWFTNLKFIGLSFFKMGLKSILGSAKKWSALVSYWRFFCLSRFKSQVLYIHKFCIYISSYRWLLFFF